VRDRSGIPEGEEELTPEERLDRHLPVPPFDAANAPSWWDHWVGDAEHVAELLKREDGMKHRGRSRRRRRFEDWLLAGFAVAFALVVVVAVVVVW
jgi:hypothetical protein